MNVNTPRRIIDFAALVEIGTGLALMASPLTVVSLLLGADGAGDRIAIGRFLGIGLLSLGIACWQRSAGTVSGSPAFLAMSIYNPLVAVYLMFLGLVSHFDGLLLWPAVALHGAVAIALAWTWRVEQLTAATPTC